MIVVLHACECSVAKSCLTLFVTSWTVACQGKSKCMGFSHKSMGFFWARILELIAIFFSRGSSWSRDWTCISCVSCIADRFFTADLLGNRNPHLMYCCILKGTKEVAWYVQKNTGALPFAPAFLKGILTVACRVGVENHRFHRPWVCHSISLSISQSLLPSLVKWGWSSLSCLPPQKIMRTKWESTHSCLENCKELRKLKMYLCFGRWRMHLI